MQTSVLCIGDIHGDLDGFTEILDRHANQSHYIVQLGDLVDRGSDSAGVLRTMFDIVDAGKGAFLRSNHDDKLYRYLLGRPVNISNGLNRTLESLDKQADRDALAARFIAAYERAPYWLDFGDHFFVHGAFHPAMREYASPDGAGNDGNRLRSLALFGETDGTRKDGFPNRTHNWINSIPAGMAVYVGHDAQSLSEPVSKTGTQGGTAVFVDTGSGKGGYISACALKTQGPAGGKGMNLASPAILG
ncbi:MAG: metallophosphoesterase [Rhodospirillales bacterium]|nr:metallophosphoesterase [Rhodospirillales bacterium]